MRLVSASLMWVVVLAIGRFTVSAQNPLPLDAPSSCVFTGSTWHGQGINGSNRSRRSLQGAFIPRDGRASADFAAACHRRPARGSVPSRITFCNAAVATDHERGTSRHQATTPGALSVLLALDVRPRPTHAVG